MFCIDNLKNGKFHQHLRDIFAPQVRNYRKTELGKRHNCGDNATTVAAICQSFPAKESVVCPKYCVAYSLYSDAQTFVIL